MQAHPEMVKFERGRPETRSRRVSICVQTQEPEPEFADWGATKKKSAPRFHYRPNLNGMFSAEGDYADYDQRSWTGVSLNLASQ